MDTQAVVAYGKSCNEAGAAIRKWGAAARETFVVDRDAVAECVMHEIMLHLPDSDPDQAMAAARSAMPRIIHDLGLAKLVETAQLYALCFPDVDRSSSGK